MYSMTVEEAEVYVQLLQKAIEQAKSSKYYVGKIYHE